MTNTTTTTNTQPVTLFYDKAKGWFVSYPTHFGFQHERVATKASSRPSDAELLAKGFEVV